MIVPSQTEPLDASSVQPQCDGDDGRKEQRKGAGPQRVLSSIPLVIDLVLDLLEGDVWNRHVGHDAAAPAMRRTMECGLEDPEDSNLTAFCKRNAVECASGSRRVLEEVTR